MSVSGAYTEYYAADGTIAGNGYGGTWEIQNDTMCFTYGEAEATCWGARIEDDQITWLMGDTEQGTGTILPGNPNDF
jgi:hypothetical protein